MSLMTRALSSVRVVLPVPVSYAQYVTVLFSSSPLYSSRVPSEANHPVLISSPARFLASISAPLSKSKYQHCLVPSSTSPQVTKSCLPPGEKL